MPSKGLYSYDEWENLRVAEGSATVALRMAAELDGRIRLGSPVRAVKVAPGGCAVQLESGEVVAKTIATKQVAIAQMFLMLQQTKALWFQAISEARPDPTKEQVLRAYAAQYTVMENANALAQLAIRTCGGQSMLKTLPLERIYRDSRCGSLMLPWTAEICLDRIGREALYEPGETDE